MEYFVEQLLTLMLTTSVLWLPVVSLSFLSHQLVRLLGSKITLAMGCIGVPVHEISHALIALLMGHRIVGMSLYRPSCDGTLGYVNHQYRPTWFSPLALFLIAIAPLSGGFLALYGVTALLRPDILYLTKDIFVNIHSLTELIDIGRSIVVMLWNGEVFATVLWLFASLSICLFCVPSKTDLRGCKRFFILLGFLLMAFTVFDPIATMGTLNQLQPILLNIAMPFHVTLFVMVIGTIITCTIYCLNCLLFGRRIQFSEKFKK